MSAKQFAVIPLAVALALSCAAQGGQTGLPVAVVRIGNHEVKAEIAATPETRQTGLMHRTSVPEGTGMLFVFPSDEKLSFWMKNTLVPLSIAYVSSDLVIREIFDMKPQSLDPVVGTRFSRYALEVPQGWFAKKGIKAGDSLELPPLPRAE